MVTLAEATAERAEVEADIKEDGVRVLLRFDKAWKPGSGGRRGAAEWVNVDTWMLAVTARSAPATGALEGTEAWYLPAAAVARVGLEASLPGAGTAPSRTGWEVHVGDGFSAPTAGASGVRRYFMLEVSETIRSGGMPILHLVRLAQ